MKIFILLFTLWSSLSWSQKEADARKLFDQYLASIAKKDMLLLKSIMTPYYLEKSGGENHWGLVMQNFHGKYQKAQVSQVEFKNVEMKSYARFNIQYPEQKLLALSDSWYELTWANGKFLIYDFHDDFIPGKVED